MVVVAIVVVVVTVLVLVSVERGDVGVDEQREKLTALDQLSVGARLVGLDVEQEPARRGSFRASATACSTT